MTTLGKYVGGGMMFGAFGGCTDIMKRFDAWQPDAFPRAGTFNNKVLTVSAGLAGMSLYGRYHRRSYPRKSKLVRC